MTRDIDIAILSVRLSVRDVPVSDENGAGAENDGPEIAGHEIDGPSCRA